MKWVSGAYGAEFSLEVVSAIETLQPNEGTKERPTFKVKEKVALLIEKRELLLLL